MNGRFQTQFFTASIRFSHPNLKFAKLSIHSTCFKHTVTKLHIQFSRAHLQCYFHTCTFRMAWYKWLPCDVGGHLQWTGFMKCVQSLRPAIIARLVMDHHDIISLRQPFLRQ